MRIRTRNVVCAVPRGSSRAEGGVLLEVLLALALIVGASSVITGGLQSAVDSVKRMQNEIHGVNLAISVISRLQMGLLEAESVESEDFEAPFAGWTYDLEVEEVSSETMMDLSGTEKSVPELQKVEVAIRNPEGQVVKRMSQFIILEPSQSGGAEGFGSESGGGGFVSYGN